MADAAHIQLAAPPAQTPWRSQRVRAAQATHHTSHAVRHVREKDDFPRSRSRSRSRSRNSSSKSWRVPHATVPMKHMWTAFNWMKDSSPLACTVRPCSGAWHRDASRTFHVNPAEVLKMLDKEECVVDDQTQAHVQSTLSQECGIIDRNDFGTWAPLTVPHLLLPKDLKFQDVAGFMCDGAGILPVMQPHNSASTYFVLGCQSFSLHSPLVGGRWTLFGGGQHDGETDTTVTAAREFLEESMGIIAWKQGLRDVPSSGAALARSLQNHEFLMCCRLRYVRNGQRRFYDVFVKRVPWDPTLPARFEAFRTACQTQHGPLWRRAVRSHHPALHPKTLTLLKSYTELDRLGIWSRQQLIYATRRSGGLLFDQNGNAMHCRTAVMPILALCLQQLDVMEEEGAQRHTVAQTTLSKARGSVSHPLRRSRVSM